MSVLALALKRLELSHGTVPKGCPIGTPAERAMLRHPDRTSLTAVPVGQTRGIQTIERFGTGGRGGTVGLDGTGGTDGDRRCLVCGQPASFGFGVSVRAGREGRWTCAAHRPQGEGRA
jgi:hypothetical protein